MIKKITVKLDDIKPYEYNAKLHPEEQINQIAKSIKELGYNDPIAIDEDNVILEGHGRYEALKKLGYTEAEVIVLEHLDEVQKKQYILAHNKLTMTTGFDEDILRAELSKIEVEDYGLDITGFSQFEIDNLMDEGDISFLDNVISDEDKAKKEEEEEEERVCPHCGEVI